MKKTIILMGMNNALVSLFMVFGLSLLLAFLIFIVARKSPVRSNYVHNGSGIIKFIPYSCGEYFFHDLNSRINLERFMIYAIYFLIFDVAGFILAVSFNLLVFPVIIYIAVILASVILVVKR